MYLLPDWFPVYVPFNSRSRNSNGLADESVIFFLWNYHTFGLPNPERWQLQIHQTHEHKTINCIRRKDWVLLCFQQLWSYRDKIKNPKKEDIPFFS